MNHPADRPSPSPAQVVPQKHDVDYIFYELTRSMCPICRRMIDAQILLRDNKVYMRKRCPEHGQFEVAVLAGGCFWGVQGLFQHVTGVTRAVSGYAGGSQATAEYETISTGTTGHAESVQITVDPQKISYGHVLQIYFSVAHDPTELNRQGPDVGTQYRSAIFPTTAEQARIAQAYIDQLERAAVFKAPIVTRIEPAQTFYPAEDYHQDYLTRNPTSPYIVINDLPKIENLKRTEPDVYRADPVLVANTRSN